MSETDGFLPSSGLNASPKKKPVKKKWDNTPTDENQKRSEEWMGASPNGLKPRRSWTVKEDSTKPKEYVKEILEASPKLDLDE